MKLRGVCIPGLTMRADELPRLDGVKALDNPEIGEGVALGRDYTLEEVAELHTRKLTELAGTGPLTICGLSMGGMIVSIMATRLRAQLPAQCRFVFLVTSPNLPAHPTLPEQTLARWGATRPGDIDGFAAILEPFFGRRYLAAEPAACRAYFEYRALGRNGQSAKAFFRQINAVRSCAAHLHFAALDPRECTFVGGGDDRVLGPAHNRDLRDLCPDAQHTEVPDLGHMIHLEQPELYARAFGASP